ncbi:hypothetical protein TNCV_4838541 [Trichonephila clavipes]|nr:hypothetical protein TNCV_4838541 [Trichonephila clavipes]
MCPGSAKPLILAVLSCRENKGRISYRPCNVQEIDYYSSGGLMVWVASYISVFERGTVTVMRCRDEVLEPYICLFRVVIGLNFLLMVDDVGSYGAHVVGEFLERGYSPDEMAS